MIFKLISTVCLSIVVALYPATGHAQTPYGTTAPVAAPGQAPLGPAPATCFPPCRNGYVCVQGQCVSLCNPPCALGEACTATGQCMLLAPPSAAPAYTTFPAGNAQRPTSADPGWARAGAVVGIVGGAVGVLLGTAAAMNTDDADVSIPLGIGATVAVGVAVPLVAAAASSARGNPQVRGASGARIAGWIGYGLTMLDAVALIGLGIADEQVYPAQVMSVTLLGGASTAAMIIDAYSSASEAESLGATAHTAPRLDRVAWTPVFGVARNALGGKDGYVGVAASF